MATSGNPRLVIAAIDFPPGHGGIQRLLSELVTRLASRWRITVLAPRDPLAERSRDAPFSVRRTRADWRSFRLGVLAEMTLLTARERPDITLAGHLNALPPLVAGAHGQPRAALVYGSELWGRQTRLVTRGLGTQIDRAMAISRFTALEAAKAGIPADRIVVTPLGAGQPPPNGAGEVLEELGLVRENRVVPFFLTVSRLTEPHKGHDVFLRAMPTLLTRFPDLQYVIVGGGDLAGRLSNLADRLGIQHAVTMTGSVDERTKAALLRACRAFVMVSRESRRPALFEGFGIAYIEAALAGRPSLAGDSGGVSDAVVHEHTGLLVDPLSIPDVTAAALRLLEDPAYADELGVSARERARRDYTWDAAIGRMERCLESMLP